MDCSRVVDDVRPKPSWEYRTATVPNPMRARLRIACTATCGSLEQACTTMSPPLRAGSIFSLGNFGRSTSASGFLSAMPNRSTPSLTKNDGPKPMVSVSCDGGRPSASPVSVGGEYGFWPVAPLGNASLPWVIRSAISVQSASILITSSRLRVVTSNVAKCMRSWASVTMPAWCGPRNGTAACR